MKIKIFIIVILFLISATYLILHERRKVDSLNKEKQPIVLKHRGLYKEQKFTSPLKYLRILAVGDTALLEPLGSRVENDPNYSPLQNMKSFFSEFDYVIAGQEGTIDGVSVGQPNPGKSYTFSTTIESGRIYKEAGIDAMVYSNNHTKDYGPNSVLHTIEILKQNNIETFGSGANNNEAYTPLIIEIDSTKIAFLAFNCTEYYFNHATESEPGTASFSEWRVINSINEANNNSDLVIVFAHWGEEHTQELDSWQIDWAKIFVNAGADIVIGSHPHVIQKTEMIEGKPVYYSIGNFMFPGQAWDPEAQKGLMVEINIADKEIIGIKEHFSLMDDDGVPSLVE